MTNSRAKLEPQFDRDPRNDPPVATSCWYDGTAYPEGTRGRDQKDGTLYECVNGQWKKVPEPKQASGS